MVSKESPNLQKFPACFILLLFLWGQMGAFTWVDWWAASLLGAFLHNLGMNQLIWEFFSTAFWFPVSPWFGWYFECWHFKPMLCSGGLLMNFSYHFPSFPWSLNQPYSCWKFYKYGCKRPSEGRVGTLPTCSASADLFEPPYKDTLWFVCKWTEEKSDLLES